MPVARVCSLRIFSSSLPSHASSWTLRR